MHAYKLALPLALAWGAALTCAYPAASKNAESPALLARAEHTLPSMAMSYPATNTPGHDSHSLNTPRSIDVALAQKRQIHNADYHADVPPPNPHSNEEPSSPSSPDPPAAPPSEPVAEDQGSKHVPPPTNSENQASTGPATHGAEAQGDQKRQIHNADYSTSNAPPPSPNPPVDQDSSPSPPSPDTASSNTAANDKRATTPLEHSDPPVVSAGDSGSKDRPDVHRSIVAMKKRSIDVPVGDGLGAHAIKPRAFNIVSREPEWYGRTRRNVEELTNINNRNFDHKAVLRWSRVEAEKMRAMWRNFAHSNM
ncbi:hypothetical protein C8R46DRAFT_1097855 [Mycena filopes]|nr:hypothetical protein C8R46DRAFT_1097855 [Mycena filopes]